MNYHVDLEMDRGLASSCGISDPVMPPSSGNITEWINKEFPRMDAEFKEHEEALRNAWEDHLRHAMRLIGDQVKRAPAGASKVRLRLSVEID